MKRQYKNVTWSPAVRPISRPTSEKAIAAKRSRIVLYPPGHKKRPRVHGYLEAHVRRHTKSLLLTIRNSSTGRRDLQLLIDLPNKQVRRIYDGSRSWTVKPATSVCRVNEVENIRLDIEKFGTITWLGEEEKIRRNDAKGFCLSWLVATKVWPVFLRSDPKKTKKTGNARSRRKQKSKRSARYRSKY